MQRKEATKQEEIASEELNKAKSVMRDKQAQKSKFVRESSKAASQSKEGKETFDRGVSVLDSEIAEAKKKCSVAMDT